MTYNPLTDDENLLEYAAHLREGGSFTQEQADAIAAALDELRAARARAEQERLRHSTVGSHRVIVEGFSDHSAEDAFAHAVDKAAHYFSEYHDVSMTLLGLVHLPDGGHHATIEIHITPMKMAKTAHRESPDLELKRIEGRTYSARRGKESGKTQRLVHDHFLRINGATPHIIPDYFMINLRDADLLNHMLEKQFFNAGRGISAAPKNEIPVVHVRIRKPSPEGTTEE